MAPQPDHLRLIEVGVEGDFPSRFTLDVFDPPPQEAMSASKDGELSIAVGYVTAVRKDHPAAILTSPIDEDTYDSWRRSDVDDCEEGVAQGETCLVQHACTLDAERCLHRALACTSSDQGFIQFNECELIGARGDESLTIAGYSVNYWVVFFSEPVAGGTPVANWYADGKPITAGYHLYRIEQTEALDRETLDCFLNASTDAVDRYNAEHGSELTLSDFAIGAHPEREVERAYSCIRSQVLQEADCSVPIRFEEVTGSIAIELGALTGFDYR